MAAAQRAGGRGGRRRSLEAVVTTLDTVEHGKLASTLDRLEATAADALERWSKPDDFAKVDLVVTKLLQDGSVESALLYLRKVRACGARGRCRALDNVQRTAGASVCGSR